MILNELFKQEVEIKMIHDTATEYEASAVIGDRTMTFTSRQLGQHMLDLEDEDKSVWRIDFYDGDDVENARSNITGKGQAFSVFSFVLKCIKHLVKQRNPDVIEISADNSEGSNRARLYARIADRFSNSYDVQRQTERGTMFNKTRLVRK